MRNGLQPIANKLFMSTNLLHIHTLCLTSSAKHKYCCFKQMCQMLPWSCQSCKTVEPNGRSVGAAQCCPPEAKVPWLTAQPTGAKLTIHKSVLLFVQYNKSCQVRESRWSHLMSARWWMKLWHVLSIQSSPPLSALFPGVQEGGKEEKESNCGLQKLWLISKAVIL